MKKIIILLMVLLATNAYAQVKVVVIPMFDETGAAKWLGEWESGKAYKSGDIVEFDDSSYIALTAHTSSISNIPPDAATWDLVAASGSDGIDGTDGVDGANGVQGIPGADGIDGDSAYQVWLNAGNTGTEQNYLDSLVGPEGPQGESGSAAAQTIAGFDVGPNSLSPITDTDTVYNSVEINAIGSGVVIANVSGRLRGGYETFCSISKDSALVDEAVSFHGNFDDDFAHTRGIDVTQAGSFTINLVCKSDTGYTGHIYEANLTVMFIPD